MRECSLIDYLDKAQVIHPDNHQLKEQCIESDSVSFIALWNKQEEFMSISDDFDNALTSIMNTINEKHESTH